MNGRFSSGLKYLLVITLAALVSLLIASNGFAACSIGVSQFAFGNYDVLSSAPLDSAGMLVFRCTQRDKDISIGIDKGEAPSFNPRQMSNSSGQGTGDKLNYNLYLDANRQRIWGDGTGGTQSYFIHNPQANNQDILVPIFGRIPPLQNVGSGFYRDTIKAVINF